MRLVKSCKIRSYFVSIFKYPFHHLPSLLAVSFSFWSSWCDRPFAACTCFSKSGSGVVNDSWTPVGPVGSEKGHSKKYATWNVCKLASPRYEVGPGVTCLSLRLRSCPLASGAEPDETTYRSPFVEVPACWKKVGYPLTRLLPMVLVKQGCHLTMEHALVLLCPGQSNSVCIVSSLNILAQYGTITSHANSI